MNTDGKISPGQAALLLVGFTLGSAILLIPQVSSAKAGRDAWFSMLLAILAGLCIIYINTNLALRFPGKNFIQYSEVILGKTLGKASGLVMIWMALHLGSLVVRDFGSFITATILPHTPILVINTIMVILSVITVKMGLEVLARVNSVLLYPLIFVLMLLTILAISNIDIKRLLPVMENGFKPVIRGALSPIGFPFAETSLFTMIIPQISQGSVKKSLLLGGLAGGLMILLITMRTLLVLGPNATTGTGYPVLEAVRMIDLFNFIQRIEALVIINWMGFGFAKITVCFYVFVTGLSQWFNLKDSKPIMLPAGIVMLALSLILFKNQPEAIAFIDVWVPFTYIAGIAVPLLLLIVSRLRGMNS